MSVTNIRVRTTSARAKPASASAASMIASAARAWAPTSPGWSDRPSGPASVVPGDPARVADDDRPAVAGDGLPRPARRDPPALGHRAAGVGRPVAPRVVAPGDDLGVARRSPAAGRPAASSGARSSRRRGTRPASGRCRRSGPSPSRLGTPSPDVVLASDAPPVEASATSKPSALGDGLGVLDQPAAPLELLHRPPAGHRLEVDGRVGDLGRLGDPRGSSASAVSSASRVVARTSTSSDAPLGDDVRPRPAGDHPDVDGDARPAAVERVEVARRSGPPRGSRCGPSRARRRRGPPGRGRRSAGRGSPCAPRRCRRWRGRIRGRARRRLSARERADVRRRASASRSPRPGWRRRRAARTAAPPRSAMIALSAYSPASSPDFMSVTPGP